METKITEILSEFRVFDAVDIAVTSLVFLALSSAIRNRRSASILVGMLMVAAFYIGARSLGLRLIAWVFEGFFAVFLVTLVVIFQEDLRRFFERIAHWSRWLGRSRGAARVPRTHPETDILVESMFDLARDRVGALVVLPGADSVGAHTHGGVEVGGALSEPLLKSLFDPHSPGHDGAVVIEGGRLVRFAVHLPLSTDSNKLVGRGTRHAAALGLSERTDALSIVVSEERGTVSVASGGELHPVSDGAALAAALEAHTRPGERTTERGTWFSSLVRQPYRKLGVFALASLLWIVFVHEGRIEYRSFDVPVRVTGLRADLRVRGSSPPRVRVIVSGPRRRFYFVDADEIAVEIKLFEAEEGQERYTLLASDATLPQGLTFVNIFPREVAVEVERGR